MDLTQQSKQHVDQVASDTVDLLDTVAAAAQNAIRDGAKLGTAALDSVNALTGSAAVQRFGQINQENLECDQILAREPAIARVAVLDEESMTQVYRICRTTPITGVSNLASYRAPVGRLASLPVGTEFAVPNGDLDDITERALLRPSQVADEWDSLDTTVEWDDFGPFSVGVNRLATTHPQPFDKYLYVGTTRAATYLGWTCGSALPDKIQSLRSMFVAKW